MASRPPTPALPAPLFQIKMLEQMLQILGPLLNPVPFSSLQIPSLIDSPKLLISYLTLLIPFLLSGHEPCRDLESVVREAVRQREATLANVRSEAALVSQHLASAAEHDKGAAELIIGRLREELRVSGVERNALREEVRVCGNERNGLLKQLEQARQAILSLETLHKQQVLQFSFCRDPCMRHLAVSLADCRTPESHVGTSASGGNGIQSGCFRDRALATRGICLVLLFFRAHFLFL